MSKTDDGKKTPRTPAVAAASSDSPRFGTPAGSSTPRVSSNLSPRTPAGGANSSLRRDAPASSSSNTRTRREMNSTSAISPVIRRPDQISQQALVSSLFNAGKAIKGTSKGFNVSQSLLENPEFSNTQQQIDQISDEVSADSKGPEDVVVRYINRIMKPAINPESVPSDDLARVVLAFRSYLLGLKKGRGELALADAVRRGLLNVQENLLRIRNLEEALQSQTDELAAKSEELESIRSELRAMGARGANERDEEFGRLQASIKDNESRIGQLNESISKATNEKTRMSEKMQELIQKIASQDEGFNLERASFEKTKSSLEVKLQELREKESQFEQAKQALEQDNLRLKGELEKIRQEKGVEARGKDLEIERLKANIGANQAEINRLKSLIGAAEVEKGEQARQINALKSRLREVESGFVEKEQRFGQERQELEARVRSVDSQSQKRFTELQTAFNAKNQALVGENQALQQQLEQQETSLTAMRQQINQRANYDEIVGERTELASRVHILEEENKQLRGHLRLAEEQSQFAHRGDNQEMIRLRRRVAELEEVLRFKEQELQSAVNREQQASRMITGMEEIITNLRTSKGDQISEQILRQIAEFRQDFANFQQKTSSTNPFASTNPFRFGKAARPDARRVNTRSFQGAIDRIVGWGSKVVSENSESSGGLSTGGLTLSTPAAGARQFRAPSISITPDDDFNFFNQMIQQAAAISFQDKDSKLNPYSASQTNHDGNFRAIFKQFISVLNKILSSSNPALTPAELKNLDSVFNSTCCKSKKITQESFIEKLKTDPAFKQNFFNWANSEAQFIKEGSAQHNAGVDHRSGGTDYPAQYAKYNKQTPTASVGQPVVSYQVTKLDKDLSEIQSALFSK